MLSPKKCTSSHPCLENSNRTHEPYSGERQSFPYPLNLLRDRELCHKPHSTVEELITGRHPKSLQHFGCLVECDLYLLRSRPAKGWGALLSVSSQLLTPAQDLQRHCSATASNELWPLPTAGNRQIQELQFSPCTIQEGAIGCCKALG